MHQSKIWQGPACLLRMLTCSYTRPEWQWFEGVVGFQLTTLFCTVCATSLVLGPTPSGWH